MSMVFRQVQRIPIENRAQWLDLRRADVTASDLGALFGFDPYKSPRQLYEEKASGRSDSEDNAVLRRGRWQEAAVVEMLAEMHPDWRIERPNDYVRDPTLRLGATTDRLATLPDGEIVAIECKSVARSVFEDDWRDGPPLRVQLQALGNGMLRGVKRMLIAVLVRDQYTDEPQEIWIERHPGAEQRIVDGVREFWRRVESSEPYPFDFGRDKDLIAALYPKGGGAAIDLSGNNRVGFLCEERLAWAQRRAACEKALEVVEAEIMALLGDADRAEHPDYNISWKLQRRKEVVMPATEYRVLRISRKKENKSLEEAA
jgi:predicted phage-related endonuclease